MANYPATPSFGGPFRFSNQMPRAPHGGPHGMPPSAYQQPQAFSPALHGASGTHPTVGSANAFAFNANAHGFASPYPSNGVPPPPPPPGFPPFSHFTNGSYPPPPFPPIPIPRYGSLAQPPAVVETSQRKTNSFQSPPALPPSLPPKPPPVSVNTAEVELPPQVAATAAGTTDREDGELSDGDTSRNTGQPPKSSAISPAASTHTGNDNGADGESQRDERQTIVSPTKHGQEGYFRLSPKVVTPKDSARGHSPPPPQDSVRQDRDFWPPAQNSCDVSPLRGLRGNIQNPHVQEAHGRSPQVGQSFLSNHGNTAQASASNHQNGITDDLKLSQNTSTESGVGASTVPYSPTAYKSPPELRNRAKATLSHLHSHSIGISQLIQEGIDEELLRNLYAELGFPLPRRTAVKTTDKVTSNALSPRSQLASNEPVVNIESTNSAEETPHVLRGPIVTSSAELANDSASLPKISNHIVDSDKFDDRASRHTPLKDVIVTPKPKPGTLSTLPRSTGSNASSKSVTVKPMDKTLERKDYIARMLAAKAGKPLPVKPSSPALAMPITPDAKVTDNQRTNPEAVLISDLSNQAAPKSSVTTDADTEAKKRAQTELARQKMEALLNRGIGQQEEPRKPNKVAPTVDTQTPSLESYSQALSGSQETPQIVTELLTSALPQCPSEPPSTPALSVKSSSQASMFASFSRTPSSGIPGLFMTNPTSLPLPATDGPLPSVRDQLNAEAISVQPPSTSNMPSIQPNVTADFPRIDGTTPQLARPEPQPTALPTADSVDRSRKRAKAADFIDPPAAKFRKPFGSGQPSRLVIEVSDDEANETADADADDYLTDLDEDAKTAHIQSVAEVSVATVKQKSIRDLPPLSDFPSAKKPMLESAIDTPPAVQTPGKGKEQEDLRRKEEQIELMNRKIAEMEQRRKAKQTASRAHTPGTPARSGSTPNFETSLAEVSKQSQAVTDVVRMIDVNTGELEVQKTRLTAAEASMKERLNTEQEARLVEVAKAELERAAAANAATVAESGQRRQRRAEIESGLPVLDAEVERTKDKLEMMKKQMEELEAELQIGMEGRKTLMQELERLAMVIEEPPSAGSPALLDDEAQMPTGNGVHVEEENAHSHAAAPPLESTDPSNIPKIPESGTSNKHAIPPTDGDQDPPPRGSEPVEATSPPHKNQVSSDDFTDDVMDTSGSSVDEGEITDYSPEPPTNEEVAQVPVHDLGDDQHLRGVESIHEDTISHATEGSGSQSLQDESMVDVYAPDPPPLAPTSSSNGRSMSRDFTNDGTELPPAEISQEEGEIEIDDSDDYEPPEPGSPVEEMTSPSHAPPLAPASPHPSPESFTDTASPPTSAALPQSAEAHQNPVAVIEDTVFSHKSVDSSQGIRSSHFNPYESPLKQFKAYRYHPNYVSEVSGGFRSMTFSHNIKPDVPICRYEATGGICNDSSCDSQHFRSMGLSDDMILVQMGSVHEGRTSEERDAYVDGLKKIIQEMRGRKIKDFNTVASEITSYRTRFLADTSRVLTL